MQILIVAHPDVGDHNDIYQEALMSVAGQWVDVKEITPDGKYQICVLSNGLYRTFAVDRKNIVRIK